MRKIIFLFRTSSIFIMAETAQIFILSHNQYLPRKKMQVKCILFNYLLSENIIILDQPKIRPMEPDLTELRKNYERFDDKKLIRIASEEAAGLRPEALDLLKQIIQERGLSPDVIKAADVQISEVSTKSFDDYVEILRSLPCPVCNNNFEKLNATIVANVFSFVLITHYSKEVKIACPRCLNKMNNNAMIKTALLGWWGLPWGIIRTPQALILNNKRKGENDWPEANNLFKSFVYERLGRIEVNRNNPEMLQDIITHIR